jgi:hypothetical protein
MSDSIGAAFLEDVIREFANQRSLAERAAAQLTDQDFFRTTSDEANSVAIIMKHVGGNLRSRWTDFLTTDGEKPDRNRDGEFEISDTRESIMKTWADGFDTLNRTLSSLNARDMLETVTIRGEPHTVIRAMNRNLAHTAHHAGQIVLLAKQWRGAEWQTLSIPKARK